MARSRQDERGTWTTVRATAADDGEGTREPEAFSRGTWVTGLGLAIVHTIMQEHGGSIDIETAPDGGTTVSLFFPRNHSQSESQS
jgi:signal transduction histidine kinase